MPPLRRLLPLLALAVAPLGAQPAPRDPLQEGLPLRPDRTLSFTTRTGQWMSLDVWETLAETWPRQKAAGRFYWAAEERD